MLLQRSNLLIHDQKLSFVLLYRKIFCEFIGTIYVIPIIHHNIIQRLLILF